MLEQQRWCALEPCAHTLNTHMCVQQTSSGHGTGVKRAFQGRQSLKGPQGGGKGLGLQDGTAAEKVAHACLRSLLEGGMQGREPRQRSQGREAKAAGKGGGLGEVC